MSNFDINEVVIDFIIGLLKAFILIYDIVTYPFYFLIYRPWSKISTSSSNVNAVKDNPSDRSTAWTSTIKLSDKSLANECNSLVELISKTTAKYGDQMCLGYRDVFMKDEEVVEGTTILKKIPSPDYKWLTYDQVDKRIDDIVRGLMKHQITPEDKVVLFMENRIEYALVAHAILRLGAVVVIVNEQTSDDELKCILNQVESCKIFTSSYLLEKLESSITDLPFERQIFYAEDASEATKETSAISFTTLVQVGSSESPSFKGVNRNLSDLAMIYYTQNEDAFKLLARNATLGESSNNNNNNNSISTKGVMLTHGNIVSAILSFDSIISNYININKLTKSQFPAHLTSLTDFITLHVMVINCIPIAFSSSGTLTDSSDSLKSGSRGDLSCIRGKIINSVPSFLDTIKRESTIENDKSVGPFKRKFFTFALNYKIYWQMKGFNTPILNVILFSKMKEKMTKHIQLIINRTQGELLAPSTETYIRSTLNCNIINGSACTETCGFFTLRSPDDSVTIGSVGAVLPGYKIKLDDWTEGGFTTFDLPHPRGEILVSGNAISTGYYGNNNNNNNNNDEATTVTDQSFVTDEAGVRWFRSGLIGEIRPNGQLYIYDKKDSMVRLEFGRSLLSLGQTEATIRSNNFIKHVFCYANEENNFIIALVNPNSKAIRSLCSTLDIEEGSLTFKEMCSDPEIQAEVMKSIIEHGVKNSLSKNVLPSKIKLCHEIWSTETNFLLPDFTLNRGKIINFYHKDISRMFNTGRKHILPPSVPNTLNNNNETGVVNSNNNNNKNTVTIAEVNDTPVVVVETKAGVEMSNLKSEKKDKKKSSSSSSSSSESEYSDTENSFSKSKSETTSHL